MKYLLVLRSAGLPPRAEPSLKATSLETAGSGFCWGSGGDTIVPSVGLQLFLDSQDVQSAAPVASPNLRSTFVDCAARFPASPLQPATLAFRLPRVDRAV